MATRLPGEAIAAVGSFLCSTDAQRAKSTCRIWKQAFEDNPRAWQNVAVELKEEEKSSMALEVCLPLSRERPVDLCIQNIHPRHYHQLNALLRLHMRHIRSLELRFEGGHRSSKRQMTNLLQRLRSPAPMLESLTLMCSLANTSGISSTPFPHGIFATDAPRLVELAMDSNFMIRTPSTLTAQITSLTIQPHGDHDWTVEELGMMYPNLQDLHLIGPWTSIYPSVFDAEKSAYRLLQLTVTTSIGVPDDSRDDAACKAISLARYTHLRGAKSVSLWLNHAFERAVQQVLGALSSATYMHVGRGGHARPLQCLWRSSGGRFSIDRGLFVQVSNRASAVEVGDSSLYGQCTDEVIQNLLFHLPVHHTLEHLSLCESTLSALQRSSCIIDLPVLRCISIVIAGVSERKSPSLSDIRDKSDDLACHIDVVVVRALSLATLKLTSSPRTRPWHRTLIDVHGRWVDDEPGRLRCVSASSVGSFLQKNVVLAEAAHLDIILTDQEVVFSEGYQEGRFTLKPHSVRYCQGL